jgi:hypothetical protein
LDRELEGVHEGDSARPREYAGNDRARMSSLTTLVSTIIENDEERVLAVDARWVDELVVLVSGDLSCIVQETLMGRLAETAFQDMNLV